MSVRHEVTADACVITIDNPPVNVLGQAIRAGLMAALDAAESAGVVRIVLTGAGRAFVAGADAREFDSAPQPPHLPDILARMERLPVIAAINGTALGGGLELALAARARIAHPQATVGLPEVTLGVVSGAGGTQRLPRLIGVGPAVDLISEGKVIPAKQALALGIVDALADDPVAAALALDLSTLGAPLSERPAPAPDPEAIAVARAQVQRRLPGQIAPLRAIELVEASSGDFAAGMAQERATFLELRTGDQAAALRHVFFAERAARSQGKGLPDPRPLSRAIVVGGGTMGAGIAYALAGIGLHVTTIEADAAAADRARGNIGALYAEAVKRGKSTAEQAEAAQAERHAIRAGYDDLPPVDIAIEAAFEDMAVKQRIFAALDAGLPTDTILATNTSYLDVDQVFADVRDPSRCLGLHFFAPAHLMKLIEVVRGKATSEATMATGLALSAKLGKIPVQAGVCDGFIGNRILTRYRRVMEDLLMQGVPPWDVDAAMEGFGMAMGPYAVQDLSGLDIAYMSRRKRGPTPVPPLVADRMVEEFQRLGRKTGAGWYDYADGKRRPAPVVAEMIAGYGDGAGVTPDAIRHRASLAMVAEGLDILDEGIARRPADIDLVMVHGSGFPRWRGGPMQYADRLGLEAVREGIVAEGWDVPPLLDRLLVEGKGLADLN